MVAGPQHDMKTGCRRGMVVEIVGPAGAGKTTLFQALEKSDPRFRTEFLPPVWNFRYIPFFVKNIFLLIPTLVRMQGKGEGKITRRELAWMAMLEGWPKILKTKAEGERKVLLLDQGPIFLMAILSEFGPESLQNSEIQAYWDKVSERWKHTLDVVIWLDTSDDILIRRIRTRQAEHMVKDKTDQEIRDFLAKYRLAYERLIGTMTADHRDIRVLRMDTGRNSVDDLVRNVFEYTLQEMEFEAHESLEGS